MGLDDEKLLKQCEYRSSKAGASAAVAEMPSCQSAQVGWLATTTSAMIDQDRRREAASENPDENWGCNSLLSDRRTDRPAMT